MISPLAAISTCTRTSGKSARKQPERLGQEVDTGCGRRAEMNRSRLKPGKGVELLLTRPERRERLRSAAGEDTPGLGELAAATVALDESLPRRKLEEAHVLAHARLADPDSDGRGRERPLAVDLDQHPHPRRVPQRGERRLADIGRNDGGHPDFR